MTDNDDLAFLDFSASSNIFGNASTFADFTQKLRPIHPHVGYRDAGLVCELKHLDSVINAKGERVLLRGGATLRLDKDRPPETYGSALIRTQRWTSNGTVDGTELEIRSPHMKAALKAVVPDYEDADIDLKHIQIHNQPFCLFHYRNELFQYGQQLPSVSEEQNHVSFLLQYMNQELNDEIQSWTMNVELGVFNREGPSLEFEQLWMAFTPREHVYIPQIGAHTRSLVVEFESMTLSCQCQRPYCVKSHHWNIVGLCIDHDDTKYGYRRIIRHVRHFTGLMPLRALKILPLRFHADADAIRAAHIARGSKVVKLQGKHHLMHKGIATMLGSDRNYTLFGEEDEFPLQTTWVKGRVMIDTVTFCEARPAHEPNLYYSRRRFEKPLALPEDFTENDLLICYYEVAGFALNEKKWGFFCVDNLESIPFDAEAFNSALILEPRLKNLVSSLVRVHGMDGVGNDDVITGKGKGMIFLLHGEPCVGKTLTAESVADHSERPLLRIDANDLGVTAQAVENALTANFHLAEKWKCVVLIDEADVYLERRTSSNLQRNSLVSVFLRVLEYYEGLLFLTTNRLDAFDPAFKSRVHLAIYYPKLDFESRLSIWKTFLDRASPESLGSLTASGDLAEFAAVELNGRQIKNIVKMAKALAVSGGDGMDISREHVWEGLDAMKTFDLVTENGTSEVDGRDSRDDDEIEGHRSAKRRRIDAA